MDTLRITTFTFGAAISPPVLLAVRTCRRKFLKDWETLERHSDSKRIFVDKQPPATLPVLPVGSDGRRNTCLKSTRRSLES